MEIRKARRVILLCLKPHPRLINTFCTKPLYHRGMHEVNLPEKGATELWLNPLCTSVHENQRCVKPLYHDGLCTDGFHMIWKNADK